MAATVPRMRSDARENRDRIVAATRALFGERGLEVGMREVARRAEVGPATLYRRFPTRDALVDEAFAAEMLACRRIVEDGCGDPDAWRGLTTTIRALVALSVRNRGFVDALLASAPPPPGLLAHRRELLGLLDGLAVRAKREGALRSDVAVGDLVLLLQAGRGLPAGPAARVDRAARRFADLTIDALRTRPAGR
ncbi:TetR/AcrR family transcriptional regulator [Amnibacterium setariae]|uniref:TetR/AcrR family transcriptional regulator n=2 Tax=Amnibacterium setariae TaxID=2306585 RepID=A0A3A1TWD0_9MICO|nr:TetR/AcrR family transcriptional regulator [Amnibacterium setariae]